MAYEEDGKFSRKMFERDQLPDILARMNTDTHVTHCVGKTIMIKKLADGTHELTITKRVDAPVEVAVEPVGIPVLRQLKAAPQTEIHRTLLTPGLDTGPGHRRRPAIAPVNEDS